MAPTGLGEAFLAAIQASLSVLLVIFYGGAAAHMKLLNSASTKAISKICVRMFLPALLIVNIGSELHAGSADRYGIILVWAIACHLLSFIIGIVAHFVFKMPDWTTVALMFNNTTSYPLLLIEALNQTGILQSLIVNDESTRQAIERAKSYFLVFATVSSCLTFAVGPRLIDSEHAPEPQDDEGKPDDEDAPEATNGDAADGAEDEQQYRDDGYEADEETELLGSPGHVAFRNPFAEHRFFPSARPPTEPRLELLNRKLSVVPHAHWVKLGPRTKWWLVFISDFFNAPLVGAVIGTVIGLTPSLQRAFFNDTQDGGIFTAWLTASLSNIGGLFVPLPVVVAGVSLYTAMQKRREGQSGEKLPWPTVAFILLIRFVFWPALSISVIWALSSRTSILGPDPMLWFALMLMPTGPPAMKLITLVQVSNADEAEESHISSLLTISYLISPILSLTVVASLVASQDSI